MKILLVDDDPDLVLLASFALRKVGGFEVITSSGGLEALELVRRERPDVVLMDYLMPDLDGAELVAKLRQQGGVQAETPVIFLTGAERSTDRKRLADLGALGLIEKPFDPVGLAHEVERLLTLSRPKEEGDPPKEEG